jgi:hypothetical protein
MNTSYQNLINDAGQLINTFTINYDVGSYRSDLFSSTYDELTGWVRKALHEIEVTEAEGRESNLYKNVRKFRGRVGDITLNEFLSMIHQIEDTN